MLPGIRQFRAFHLLKLSLCAERSLMMYVIDGVAYAGERVPELKVSGVRPMDNGLLWVRFSTGETRIVDFKPLLSEPVFTQLADVAIFRDVYIDHGVTVWADGEIDIAPETLYEMSVSAESAS